MGEEVAHAWNITRQDMSRHTTLSHRNEKRLIECNCRHELAVLLLLKMLLYMLEDESREANWTGFATDWLFGELVMSSDSPEDNLLACGKLSDGNSYWNFVAKHHGRVCENAGE